MGGVNFDTLRKYTLGSNYGIGELKLTDKGDLKKINHHASERYAGKNKVCTTDKQNEAVRASVYNCLLKQFGSANGRVGVAMSLAHEVLTENGNENAILSRDEAGYIISMLEGAEKGEFDYDKCKADILLIREIKRTGVNDANMKEAQRLIRGLQSSGFFSDSIAIRKVSENYRHVQPAVVSSVPTPGSTPTGDLTPGFEETPTGDTTPGFEETPTGDLTPGFEETPTGDTTPTGGSQEMSNAIKPGGKTKYEKVFPGMKPGDKLEDEPMGDTWKACKPFVQALLENKENLGLADDSELSYLKMYLTKDSHGLFEALLERNKTGITLDELAVMEMTGPQGEEPLTSLIRGMLKDVVKEYRSFMADGWKTPSASEYKVTGECGPKSKDDVVLNRVWRQTNGMNTCFMVSLVNGLAQTQRGVSLLQNCFQGNTGGFKVHIGGKKKTVKFGSDTTFEKMLHGAYGQELTSRGRGQGRVERFGEPGNAEDFAPVLGLRTVDTITIGCATPDDKFKAFSFAARVSEALKEGKVCTLYDNGHYRAISSAYINSDGIPMFQLLESNNRPPTVDHEPVSKSMRGDFVATIRMFELPEASGPTFDEVNKQIRDNEALLDRNVR